MNETILYDYEVTFENGNTKVISAESPADLLDFYGDSSEIFKLERIGESKISE